MIIAIGTTNPAKIQAVKELIKEYPLLSHAEIQAISVSSGISDQPLSLEEMILGAKNRARLSYEACHSPHYGIGIESGLFEAKGTQTGYLEACICCVYDGARDHIGLSCGFEIPPAILKIAFEQNIELNDACHQSGITNDKSLGSADGLIGLLTKGRINRKEYTKQCLKTAFIQIENSHWYN